jgi:predicted transposase/invertase (TIGR01784 family)
MTKKQQNIQSEQPDEPNKFIRFDWAAKRMLRDKANFVVLEGLITVLLNEKVRIVEILESEANQEYAFDKFNRVDIKAKNEKDEIIIVEIQLTREIHYLERILYGVSKAITEHISLGDDYNEVKKIYSISILYFNLGEGTDYLYHGTTTFTGVHTGDRLNISERDRVALKMRTPSEVFPEYFIIRVNEFNRVATTPLEDWIDYLKTGNIRQGTEAPGLNEARERLKRLSMPPAERKAYERHLDLIRDQNEMFYTAHTEGHAEGVEEGINIGLERGREEASRDIARKMKASGMAVDAIAAITGLSSDEIAAL